MGCHILAQPPTLLDYVEEKVSSVGEEPEKNSSGQEKEALSSSCVDHLIAKKNSVEKADKGKVKKKTTNSFLSSINTLSSQGQDYAA